MSLTELMRSLGERLHERESVRRIRQHADQYVVPSDATEALFVVHPYFDKPKRTPDDEELSRVLEGTRALLHNIPKVRKLRREQRDLRRMIQYAQDEDKFARYSARLHRAIARVAVGRMGTVLVESLSDYWGDSSSLVESGRINQVILTYDRLATVVRSERANLPDHLRGIQRGFIAGKNGFQCPLVFARSLVDLGIQVVPVSDLLFDNYSRPEAVIAEWRSQRIPFDFSVTSSQLQ